MDLCYFWIYFLLLFVNNVNSKNKKEQLIEKEKQSITDKKKKVLENLALGRQKRIDNLELKQKERDEEKTLNKKV